MCQEFSKEFEHPEKQYYNKYRIGINRYFTVLQYLVFDCAFNTTAELEEGNRNA